MENFTIEKYNHARNIGLTNKQKDILYTTNNGSDLVFNNPTECRFCEEIPLEENSTYNISGPPNPKTFIEPIIAPPLAELEHWKTNNLIVHSAINDSTNYDNFLSGYHSIESCKNTTVNKDLKENYNNIFPYEITQLQPGQINTACAYNPENSLNSNVPYNFPLSNCQKDPVYKEYNKNLFTQTIHPGIYSNDQIIEPINSNIGISFQPQFIPNITKNNSAENIYTKNSEILNDPGTINESNVYDPRFSGYGTSYRSYIDKNLGQTKFYYDDINSIRMPNYISRSNIDFEKYSDTYGPIPENWEFGNENHSNIRELANNSFTNNTIKQRTELMNRLTNKQRSNAWQQRMMPIQKNGGQRSLGSIGSCK